MRNWISEKKRSFTFSNEKSVEKRTAMNFNTIIIDDEPNSIKLLHYLIDKECPELTVTGTFLKPEEGLKAILQNPPDLLFLDIEMPYLNGFELLDKCSKPLPFNLIFTTAYDQYAVKAFQYSALHYLLKPISKDDLRAAVQKNLQLPKPTTEQVNILQQFNSNALKSPTRLTISTLDGLTFVELEDILYCHSEGAYTNIFVRDEVQPILVSKPIKDIEDMLEHPHFFRSHHSYLINLKHVKRFIKTEGNDVIMSNGVTIPVSRSRKQDFITAVSSI